MTASLSEILTSFGFYNILHTLTLPSKPLPLKWWCSTQLHLQPFLFLSLIYILPRSFVLFLCFSHYWHSDNLQIFISSSPSTPILYMLWELIKGNCIENGSKRHLGGLVEHLTLDFSSGRDLMGHEIRLHVQEGVCLGFCFSIFLCPSPCTRTRSLIKNKSWKIK